jgi:hypothetical protein
MLNHLLERVRLPGSGGVRWLGDEDEVAGPNAVDRSRAPARVPPRGRSAGVVYQVGPYRIEKRVVMAYGQNTVHVRYRLLDGEGASPDTAELVLAADQFIITPAGRAEEAARARAAGDEVRTVIAGYHWFTDWGRDTMISLEGLTLCTGRHREAGYILRTFAQYVRDGLIPNMFPEGARGAVPHRRRDALVLPRRRPLPRGDGDLETLRVLLPNARRHRRAPPRGTASASASTRATACCARARRATSSPGWTPRWTTGWSRRGAARPWRSTRSGTTRCGCWRTGRANSAPSRGRSRAARRAGARVVQPRFWYEEGATSTTWWTASRGDDPACRPNQVFAISLDHPVLDRGALGAGAGGGARAAADAGRPALARAGPPGLQAEVLRRPALARRRLSPGHGLGLADRAVRRRLAEGAPRRPAPGSGRARCLEGFARTWTRPASARSARSSTPSRRSRRAAASPRPGAWPR